MSWIYNSNGKKNSNLFTHWYYLCFFVVSHSVIFLLLGKTLYLGRKKNNIAKSKQFSDMLKITDNRLFKFFCLCLLQLKISFNESSLQSTYEYPSESSVWDSGDEEEEEKRDGKVADEQPSMVGRIHIPRPSFTSSPTHMNNSNGETAWNEAKGRNAVNLMSLWWACRLDVQHISTAISHIAVEFPADIHGPQRMILNDFAGSLIFPLKQNSESQFQHVQHLGPQQCILKYNVPMSL